MSPPYGYPIVDEDNSWFSRGGISIQPNLLAGLLPYLDRDEPEVYLWMFFNAWLACYREEINAMVEHLKETRSGVVWLYGMLPKPEIIQILSHATVFACPSLYEPLGIVNLEAMACGAAVVASNVEHQPVPRNAKVQCIRSAIVTRRPEYVLGDEIVDCDGPLVFDLAARPADRGLVKRDGGKMPSSVFAGSTRHREGA